MPPFRIDLKDALLHNQSFLCRIDNKILIERKLYMANDGQLKMLLNSIDAWNAWREEHSDSKIDLTAADLSHANLQKADLSHADLTNARLPFARLKKADLLFANMNGADLRGADLHQASLEDADLRNANLSHAHLEKAVLVNANCKDAQFSDANLSGADLRAANFEGVNVSAVIFDQKSPAAYLREIGLKPGHLWRRRYDIMLATAIRCRGIRESCYGNRRFTRFLHDQEFLEEMQDTKSGTFKLFIWWLLADCGRSIARWALWSVLFAVFFAVIYYLLGPDHFRVAYLPFSFVTTFYYSIVTFTTLGFGDFVPRTLTAALFVMIEVVTGYIMLGGLISIFANKIARRGE